MRAQERQGGSTEERGTEVEEPRAERLPVRQGCGDEESMVVEIAWLIVDGAKLLRRMRRIPARL
jgi:hypothetical protein